MQIKVAQVVVENKGKYKVANVIFNDLNKGTESKKSVVSFGDSEAVFMALASAKEGNCFDVKAKQDGKYWNWVEITKIEEPTSPMKSFAAPNKSNYETPEERAFRQVLIVNQSSVSNAIEFHATVASKKATLAEVLATAKVIADFVFGRTETKATPMPAAKSIDTMEDSIPF